MKVAIWLETDYRPKEGGGFSYYDKLVKALDNYAFNPSLEICFVSERKLEKTPFNREVICLSWSSSISLREKILTRLPIVRKIYRKELHSRLLNQKNIAYREQLQAHGVKVIYYLNQTECRVPDFPFVATNWDIGHCSTYAFPELIMNGEYERRSYFYSHVLPHALYVFAESEAGKKELLQYTRISENKIKVVPIFAGNSVTLKVSKDEQKAILDKYGLEQYCYFFYPAQFWAHKNHINLLNAFSQFLNSYPNYKLVLTGADHGNLSYVQKRVQELQLNDNVVFPGFVSQEQINTFYQNATALVMASFFGPTNMPPIEAMELSCPVICSDIAGHHEILEDAAIYFDCRDYKNMAKAMENMEAHRAEYVKRINEQREKSKFNIKTALQNIDTYLQELIPIRSSWA